MGWSIGFDSTWNRDIGYGVPAQCDHPSCTNKIDRGLSYVCGGEAFGEPYGCGLYFCEEHLWFHTFKDGECRQVCFRCNNHKEPYHPKPDTEEWLVFKMLDESWAEWRETQRKKFAHLWE